MTLASDADNLPRRLQQIETAMMRAAHLSRDRRLLRQAVRCQAQQRYWRFYHAVRDWSFVQHFAGRPIHWRREPHVLMGLALLMAFLVFVVVPSSARVGSGDASVRPRVTQAMAVPLPMPNLLDALDRLKAPATPQWRQVEVKPGQTMGDIFAQQGVSSQLLHRLLAESRYAQALTRIRPAQQFGFLQNDRGDLQALRFDADETKQVTVRFEASNLREEVQERPLERRVRLASGQIQRSLFTDGEAAGMSDAMILQMAGVFGYDIDFAQDLRRGDRFAVVYEQIFQDGLHIRDGAILAASFTNQGKRYTALRFGAEGQADFYDAQGRSLRKAFLRTPVEFTRISSRFSLGRKHPILGRMRAHRGVDYAAPTGTPIRAAGNGKIAFRGWKNGYGNVVEIAHGEGRTTLYGHMSRFASNLRAGQKVSQGQVVGYVGMTGLATGPHLHYEFRVGGVHRDPLTIPLPNAQPLAGDDLLAFHRDAAPLLSQLAVLEQKTGVLASADQ